MHWTARYLATKVSGAAIAELKQSRHFFTFDGTNNGFFRFPRHVPGFHMTNYMQKPFVIKALVFSFCVMRQDCRVTRKVKTVPGK